MAGQDAMAQAIREELELRWRRMLERVAAGDDIPPSLRLRAEGLMEALVLAGASTEAELQAAMSAAHARETGNRLEAQLSEDWQRAHPFPQIPFFQQRAPVYPGTAPEET